MMNLNSLIFPRPKSTYTHEELLGHIIYIPRVSQPQSASTINSFIPKSALGSRGIDDFASLSFTSTCFMDETLSYVGECIPCLYLPCEKPCTKLMLFFHGNAEDIGGTTEFLEDVQESAQMAIIAMEYPGYGIYKGSPSAERIEIDASIVFSFITEEIGIRAEDILIMGRSIGSGPATYLASVYPICALLLVSAFTCVKAVAKHLAGPIGSLFVADRFKNIENIKKVNSPTVIFHGKADKMIPCIQAHQLFKNAGGPTKLILPPFMDHNNLDMWGDLLSPMVEFFENIGLNRDPTPLKSGIIAMPFKSYQRPVPDNPHKVKHLVKWF